MTSQELFEQTKSWLEQEKLRFHPVDETSLHFAFNGDNALLRLRVECEDQPLLLVVTTALQLRVPDEKLPEVALVLHELNSQLRFGAFQLQSNNEVVVFRLPVHIRPEADLPEQIGPAIYSAARTLDEKAHALSLLIASTAATRKTLNQMKPKTKPSKEATESRLPGNRLELN